VKLGVPNVKALLGGIGAWVNANYPLTAGKNPK